MLVAIATHQQAAEEQQHQGVFLRVRESRSPSRILPEPQLARWTGQRSMAPKSWQILLELKRHVDLAKQQIDRKQFSALVQNAKEPIQSS
ncbi:hypothetical protein CFAM422_009463 [Trichoderma lentiforme]|uniref:Uncharacterized protein n=1 Tax=Trichoderma lentiforme TaxID=1567552 RepID=A0A9P4XB11_9HYPO|nr:hypothetical protein CFAM422_009463 [Trichoderma lentiforme]